MPDPIFSDNPLEGYGTSNNQGVWLQFNARNPNEPMLQANGNYNPDAFMHPSDGGTGWKMHISAKTPEAIRQLADLAAEYKIPAFKLAISEQKLEQFQDSSRGQAGKAAVFYYTEKGVDGKPIDWKAFAQDAQNVLDRNGGAGADVQRDKALPGSDGIFYRHGEDAEGNYRPRAGITEYMRARNIDSNFSFNLGNREDPFKDIEIKSGAANVPGYDKIPKDWTVEKSKSRGEDFIRRAVDSQDDAKALIAELKDQGIEAAMRTKRGGFLVEIRPESEDAFRDLQARQAASSETAVSPRRSSLPEATSEEFAAYVERKAAERAAMDAGEARAEPVTDSYKPFTKDEARAYFERKIAEREANIAANSKPAGYEMRDNGGAFNIFISEEYNAMQVEKVPGRPSVDTDNKLVVSAGTPEAMAELEKLAAASKIPMFRTEEGKATFYFSDKAANGQPLDWQEFAKKAEAIAEKSGVEKASAVRYVIEGDENPFTAARSQKPAMSAAESKAEFERFRAEFNAEYEASQSAAKAGRTPIDPNKLGEKTYNIIMNAPDTELVPLDNKWAAGDDGSIRRPMDSIRSPGKMITALKEAGITATVRENNKTFSIEVPASDAKKFRDMQALQNQREQIYDWQDIQEAAGKPVARENKLGMPAYEDGKIVWKDATYPPLQEAERALARINATASMMGIKPDDTSNPDVESLRQPARDKIATAEAELSAERLQKLMTTNPVKIAGYNPDDPGNMVTAYKEQIAKLQQPAAKAAANIPETGWQEMTTAKGQALLSYQTGTYEEATALRDALKEKGIKARPMDSNGAYSVRIEGDEVGKFRAIQPAAPDTVKATTPSARDRMLNAGEDDAAPARPSPTATMPEQPIRTVGTEQAERDAKRSAAASAATDAPDTPAMDSKPAAPDTPSTTPRPGGRANAVTGLSSGTIGLGMSAYALKNSIEQGDGTGIAVASGNLATAAADTAADAAPIIGRTVSEGAKGILKKANVVATVADGIYQIANEQEGYKGQRTAAVAVTTGTSIAAGAAGTALAGTLAAGATATVATIAAPITLAVGAAVGVGYIGDKIIETNKLNDQIDKSFQITERYRNATGAWLDDDVMARMDKMGGKRTLVAGGGYSEKGEYYDLIDPANVQKLKQVIKEEKAKYQDKMDKNESSWPRLLMVTDSQRQAYSKYEDAKWNERRMASAEKELDAYLVTNVAKDFNERNRPALIAALEENKQFLRPGTKPEDLVPMLSTGDSIQAMQLPKDATPEQIAEKLAQYAPIARENEKKLEALKTELALINERKAIAAKEMQASMAADNAPAAGKDPMAEKLEAFKQTDEYKFAQFKIDNLERGIESTRAAEKKLGKNVDTDENMERNLLEMKADLLKKQEEYLATGSITRNSFSPAILEPLKPVDRQKPAASNGIDEANMAMAPKQEEKKPTSMLSEGNTIIAKPESEPSKRPEDLAAALAKSGFKNTLGDVAALDMNKKETGQLTSTTLSDGQRQQDGRMA